MRKNVLKVVLIILATFFLSPFLLFLAVIGVILILGAIAFCLVAILALLFGVQFIIAMIISAIIMSASSAPCNLCLITYNLCVADKSNRVFVVVFEVFIWEHIVIAFALICVICIFIVCWCTGTLWYKIDHMEEPKLVVSNVISEASKIEPVVTIPAIKIYGPPDLTVKSIVHPIDVKAVQISIV